MYQLEFVPILQKLIKALAMIIIYVLLEMFVPLVFAKVLKYFVLQSINVIQMELVILQMESVVLLLKQINLLAMMEINVLKLIIV